MKVKFSGLPVGSCFVGGRGKGRVRKKVEDGRYASVGKSGKAKSRDQRGDPDVQSIPCPLNYIGVGLRGTPEQVVEIGNGRPRERRKR